MIVSFKDPATLQAGTLNLHGGRHLNNPATYELKALEELCNVGGVDGKGGKCWWH